MSAVHANDLKEVKTFNGLDFVIALVCIIGIPGSILHAVAFIHQGQPFLAVGTSHLGGFLLLLLRQLFRIHQQFEHRPRAYPILWRYFRRFVSSMYHTGFKEWVPKWLRIAAMPFMAFFILVWPALWIYVPVLIIASIFL